MMSKQFMLAVYQLLVVNKCSGWTKKHYSMRGGDYYEASSGGLHKGKKRIIRFKKLDPVKY